MDVSPATPDCDYINLQINGPLSIEPIFPEGLRGQRVWINILMGPTGSGKSTFIESVSPSQRLSLSKDTLESVTKEVYCYKINNLYNKTAHMIPTLLDTPGFLDMELSESRITAMITKTLNLIRQCASEVHVCILYFLPIHEVRMGNSKRGAVSVLKGFAQLYGAGSVKVVTTMWNTISTPNKMDDASRRFDLLKTEIFQKSGRMKFDISKFDLTVESILSIIDPEWLGWSHHAYMSEAREPTFYNAVRDNLLERITRIEQRLQDLDAERRSLRPMDIAENKPLLGVINEEHSSNIKVLQGFLDDLYELDHESCSCPFPNIESLPVPRPPSPSSSQHIQRSQPEDAEPLSVGTTPPIKKHSITRTLRIMGCIKQLLPKSRR